MDVIEPQARVVEFRGERLEIRPLTIGSVPGIVRKASGLIDALMQAPWLIDEQATDAQTLDGILGLIADHGEALWEAVALAIGRDPLWVSGSDAAEFMDLAMAVLEVNRDFFTRRIAPLLGGLRLPAPGLGRTASSS
ncbi:hypothetical protein [Pseudoxanthomonas indica]|nr:hypothetical protein [Pseudoxanthomonas indica]